MFAWQTDDKPENARRAARVLSDARLRGLLADPYSTVRMGAPSFFTSSTRNFAGTVSLALRPTV